MLLLDFSHTLSNNNFNTIADLSVLVKNLITQMCPVGPSIQVYVADSVLSSSSQSLHNFKFDSSHSSSISDKPWITFKDNIFLHPMSFSLQYLHIEKRTLLKLQVCQGT